jgi:hypothetical protein
MKKLTSVALLPDIDNLILSLRDQKVILDTDLAAIYGVPTFRFKEAVRRNRDRFPADFMFPLTREEWASLKSLRSQIAMLKPGRGRHRKYPPQAFTEHGALMAANMLKSPRAVEMSVYVIRAFVKMRSALARNKNTARRVTAPLLREFVNKLFDEEEYEPLEGRWIFRSGGSCGTCIDGALKVAEAFAGRVVGYYSNENPTALVGVGCCEGHDFALIDERFIVDYWAFRVAKVIDRAVFDLHDSEQLDLAKSYYGKKQLWEDISALRQERRRAQTA